MKECDRKVALGHIEFGPCAPAAPLQITYTVCGVPVSGASVGVIGSDIEIQQPDETWSQTWYGQTGPDGSVTVQVRPASQTTATTSELSVTVQDSAAWAYATAVLDLRRDWSVAVYTRSWAVLNEPQTVTAVVRDQRGDAVGAGVPVTLVTDNGVFGNPPGSSQYATQTAADGTVSVNWTPASCPGTATITATASAQPCNATFTDSRQVQLYCEDPGFVDVFFCIDVTGSMNSTAIEPLVQLVDDIREAAIPARWSGLKFGDSVVDRFGGFTTDAGEITLWLRNGVAVSGGDAPENQLAALAEATVTAAEAYVLMATDDEYHHLGDDNNPRTWHYPSACTVTDLTVQEVAVALGLANCKTFVDPGSSLWVPVYEALAVGGAVEANMGTYTFPVFRQAIGLD